MPRPKEPKKFEADFTPLFFTADVIREVSQLIVLQQGGKVHNMNEALRDRNWFLSQLWKGEGVDV